MSQPAIPKNHPNQQRSRRSADKFKGLVRDIAEMASKTEELRGVEDNVDDRETPPCVFDPLQEEFDFTLDAAASTVNAKCLRFCTLHGFFIGKIQATNGDGFAKSWDTERVWINPPFSVLRPWVEKAWDDHAELVVMLLPNNRGEQPFWQDLIEPYRDRAGSILTTRNLRKRRPFLHMGEGIGNRTSKSPPFGLVVVIWDRRDPRPEMAR